MTKLILEKAIKGKRLTEEEGMELFKSTNLLKIGNAANQIRQKKKPSSIITYIIDRNINYTNICVSRCKFCAFYRNSKDKDAYLISWKELQQKIEETISLDGKQILLQGGLHPNLQFYYYLDLIKKIKDNFSIHIHAFSPPEIIYFSNISGLPVKEIIYQLKEAGLDSIPGGGAEILTERIRKKISPNKCTAKEWLSVMEIAHHSGLKTTATMMFGHIETFKDRIKHLIKLRELQDKTNGFTAFIPWSFQPHNTKLKRINAPVSGFDYLKTLAISRLMLDNFENIQASWVTQGAKIAQLSLFFGANDLGSTMIEENVVRSAGVSFKLAEKDLINLITSLSLIPRRRNFYYDIDKKSITVYKSAI